MVPEEFRHLEIGDLSVVANAVRKKLIIVFVQLGRVFCNAGEKVHDVLRREGFEES